MSENDTWKSGYVSRTTIATNRIYFLIEPNSTVEQWKTWLSNNNVILYYVLNTPTYTIITEQALISQLESLQNQRSIDGTNVITSECEEGLPVRIGVSALLKEVA